MIILRVKYSLSNDLYEIIHSNFQRLILMKEVSFVREFSDMWFDMIA